MPVQHHPLEQIINVQWDDVALHFLYSGADGMFGSSDGQTWERAPSSRPAVSLAWVDDVWIGCGPDGCWRSVDGAETWESVDAPAFREVAAMTPEGSTADGGTRQGVFAGWAEDEGGDNHIVYTSHDLGRTWAVALTIPTNGGTENGFEGIQGLSGCGAGLFVCTIWQSSPFHHGDGKIYSSTDGHDFSAQTVFGPGNTIPPEEAEQYPRIGYTASAVGYDAETDTYIAVGEKGNVASPSRQETDLIYTISPSPSFGAGMGTSVESGVITTPGGGRQIGSVPSAAGGDGRHVTGSSVFNFSAAVAFINEERKARSIPGESQTLQTSNVLNGSYIGSFCFLAGSTDDGGEGIFACTSFAADKSGGAYAATPGGAFAKTHAGTAIDVNGRPRAAVAVGTLSFIGEPDAGL